MIREGNVSANLDELLPEIRRVVRRVARNEAIVDDIVQECCLRILQKERLWNPDKGMFKAWVLTVARNLSFNFLARWRRERTGRTASATASPERTADGVADPEALEWILDRFREVPPAQKEALILRYYHGLNTAEIARILGVSRPAVADRLERALEGLRRRSRSKGLWALCVPWNWDLKAGLEVSSMGVKHKVAVTGMVCLVVGVAGTRMAMNSSRAEPSVEEKTAARLTLENRALKARLAKALDERIPSLESELTNLRSAADRVEAPPKEVPPPQSESEASAAEVVADAAMKGIIKNAADVAKLLGLEPARQKYFAESYERLLPKVQEAEKRHVKVSRQGLEVEIHIPPFPDEGRVLKEEWSNLLKGALTAPEQERYKELKLDRILFPREIGLWDRYMVFQPEPDVVWPKIENGNRYWPRFYERWTKPGEPAVDPATRWVWGGPDAYHCYRHLLDPSDCNLREEGR